MQLNLDLLLVILGFVLIFEGMPWFLSPQSSKRVLAQLFVLKDRFLRSLGLVFMLIGLWMVYLGRG